MARVWFITGTSSGFGQELALAALARGDKVIATARNASKLKALEEAGADVMQFDVTSSLQELKKAAEAAKALHGTIDFLINNAGYVQDGSIEEMRYLPSEIP
jgi:NAD(P)-dependent dehydrogenase (short-subunit alcohol dehydrogenase family)